jgi:hypothetical protein
MEIRLANIHKITLGGIDTTTCAISLAMKRAGFRGGVYGIDDSEQVNQAWKRGCISDGGGDCHAGMKSAELIVLSQEGGDPRDRLATLLELAEPGSIVLDTTRIKGHEDSVFESCGRDDVRHVGFHIVQDTLKTDHSENLSNFFFDGKAIVLTPRVKADYPAYRMISDVFETVGANVIAMSPSDFRDRYALLEAIPDLLDLIQLEEVFRVTADDAITGEFLGVRLGNRVRRLRQLQDKSWFESFSGATACVVNHLANIENSIASLRKTLTEETVKARAAEVLRQSARVVRDVEIAKTCQLIVTTAGDTAVKQRIAKALAQSQVVIQRLDEMIGTNGDAFKLELRTEEERDKAAQSLRAAGINIEIID